MPIIVTPQPPISTFERDSGRVGASYNTVVDVPLFVRAPDRSGEGYAYPRTMAAITKITATNLGNTTALVSARTVDFSFLRYSATLVGGAGDGSNTLEIYGLSGGGVSPGPNYRLFDVTDPDAPVKTTLGATIGGQTSAMWSPDGRYLMTTGPTTDDRVLFYDFNTGSPVPIANPLTLLNQGVGVGCWSPDGTKIALGYRDVGTVEIHDWPAGGPPVTLPSTPAVSTTDLAWRPSGRYLAVTHFQDGGLSIYDDNTGSWVKTALPAINVSGTSRHVAWSPNSRYLAVGHSSGSRLNLYDWTSGSPVLTSAPSPAAPTPLNVSNAIAWSANSRYVAQAGVSSPYVRAYDMDTGSPVALPELPAAALGNGTCCVWSPDGGTFVLGYTVASDDEFTDVPYLVQYAFNGTEFNIIDSPDLRIYSTARALTWNDTRDLLFVLAFNLPALNGASLDNVRLTDNTGDNKIANGSFEDTTGMTPTSYGFIGDVPDWTCTDGLDVPKTCRVYTNNKRGIIPTDGIAWVDMLGGGSLDDALTAFAWTVLRQTVTGLTNGVSYNFSFDAALMAQAAGVLRVFWGGQPVTLTTADSATVTVANPLDIRTIVRNVSVSAGETVSLPLAKTVYYGGDLLQVQSVGADCDVSASYVLMISTD